MVPLPASLLSGVIQLNSSPSIIHCFPLDTRKSGVYGFPMVTLPLRTPPFLADSGFSSSVGVERQA